MKESRICCVCCRALADAENYYKIDGVRFWCIPCGAQWLKDHNPNYQDLRGRVAAALAEVDQDKLVAKARYRKPPRVVTGSPVPLFILKVESDGRK